jgi:uncharacterized protein (DUF433 family)/DNA-binding transcriptional MerR regulator
MATVEVLGFSVDQVSALTGLSLRQLQYWDATGLFRPGYSVLEAGPAAKVYSFRDLVGLATLDLLAREHKIPVRRLRDAGKYLKRYSDAPWSSLAIYVGGKEIAFRDPEHPSLFIGAAGRGQAQVLIPIELKRVAADLRAKVGGRRRRDPADYGRIEKRRKVARNAAVLAGTRIPTSAVWSLHRAGYDTAGIRREYPRLTRVDIREAIKYEALRRRKTAS